MTEKVICQCVGYVAAIQCNTLACGDCFISERKCMCITLTNRSKCSEVFRYQWPTHHPLVTFSPTAGHIYPGRDQDIMVTFMSESPVTLLETFVCHVTKICLMEDAGVCWDNRIRQTKWVDVIYPDYQQTAER